MSTISWNCRGLGNPCTVRTLQDLVSRCQPKFIFLIEMKINREKVEKVQRRLRFDGLFFVEGVNAGVA